MSCPAQENPDERMIVVDATLSEGILGGTTESSSEDEVERVSPSVPALAVRADVRTVSLTSETPATNPLHSPEAAEDALQVTHVHTLKGSMLSQYLTMASYPTAVRYAMEIAELCDRPGGTKKRLALELMRAQIDDLPPGAEKGALEAAYGTGAMADCIDVIASASSGKSDINRRKSRGSRLISLLSGCLRSIAAKSKCAHSDPWDFRKEKGS
jgi:hypothetical protein